MTVFMIERTRHYTDVDNYPADDDEIETDFGYFTDRETAEQVAERENRPNISLFEEYRDNVRRAHRREMSAYKRKLAEHEALVAAGLRKSGSAPEPPDEPDDVDFNWWKHLRRSTHGYTAYSVIAIDPAPDAEG